MRHQANQAIKEKSRLSKEEWREYTKTVWVIANTRREDHPAIFPDEIPRRLIKLFSFSDELVLDPFAGVGTTARVALRLGRRAVCVDQNANYISIIKRECQEQYNGCQPDALQVVHGDSRNMEFIGDNSIALVVTSPPYWDKADYGKNARNLGNQENYARFLQSVRPVFRECLRVLMPGGRIVITEASVAAREWMTDGELVTLLDEDDTLVGAIAPPGTGPRPVNWKGPVPGPRV